MTDDKTKHPEEQILQEGDPETTGHIWDGIKEFNNPMPRWWLWTFYATIIWGIGYTIAYPAWPLIQGATPGLLGYSTRAEVQEDIQTFEEMNAPILARIAEVELAEITPDANPDLYSYAVQGGAAIFATWCSQCHGSGAAGVQASGYPNLLDDDWLWGGTIDDIHFTISHGIRNDDDPDARYSEMTAYDEILTDEEIASVVQYVRNISGQEADATLAAAGEEVYLNNCAACHMDDGSGDQFLGAPNLTDAIWLYGGSEEAIEYTVRYSRFGVMPPWSAEASEAGRLSEAEVRAVSVYVHSLGGGE
ncbi:MULTISPECIES: cytochrome-c oxidase, cbb3-type subunit III [Paracoccaceae]|jgi:cytochrome c oxidase cbb3-type subunit 3|uniref:cytochrome-c oxidase, cbb3-type subunit III n=1 Tax=Rhodobacterales TaxID=204455 RepID=UPI001B032A0C|nr:cytochrome-c oxidase, cbb3-type subunit III [Boseongicola sp. H5]MBO6603287.1 cytochrome-c oxidase, cbb3-type subunit III [Roseicyclus sp.]MBO6624374.1 cytochrome-c oxidase, cbb3-type subunit III [Roseicyclus sp.]MBO6922598.1 cytochrome-c oxidase, cbb3-type subunit III [Roseicyclus sp.]